jgi:SNF2 family DNA or RNA helicase
MDGSVPSASRMDLVNRFNNDPTIDVFLLSTSVGQLVWPEKMIFRLLSGFLEI